MPQNDITNLLLDWNNGNEKALEELMPIVYSELRRLAASRMQKERFNNTLQATALVNEAYMRLVSWKNVTWKNRAHFFSVASQLMRNILVENARSQLSSKRGGRQKLSLEEVKDVVGSNQEIDLVALDDALKALEIMDPQQSKIIELRYFGGLTIEETAEVMSISPATIKREWTTAKAWLLRELSKISS